MKSKSESFSKKKTLLDLISLYISKTGGIVLGIFILPWYQILLGPYAFGYVSLVLAVQAFLLMFDLGMSTLVGRDMSHLQDKQYAKTSFFSAVNVLHMLYGILLISALASQFIWTSFAFWSQIQVSILLFWAVTVQNLFQTALLADKKYTWAASLQAGGSFSKAFITILCLKIFTANLDTFLLAQLLVSLLHLGLSYVVCFKVIWIDSIRIDLAALWQASKKIARRGRPLILYGLAGASVLQLDKVIISLFSSPTKLSPYFLATTLSMAPISIMAGPLNQYFQPKIYQNILRSDSKQIERQLRHLISSILVIVIFPSFLFWINRDNLILLWIKNYGLSAQVSHYAAILIPGVALGSLGFVPYTILVANEDYKFQSLLSALLTTITLLGTAFLAYLGNIDGICWLYAFYHVVSCILSWMRCTQFEPRHPQNYVTQSALYTLKLLVPGFLIIFLFQSG